MAAIYGRNCIISEDAKIGESTRIGNFVFVRDNTVIGKGCMVGSYVDIEGDVRIGDSMRAMTAACMLFAMNHSQALQEEGTISGEGDAGAEVYQKLGSSAAVTTYVTELVAAVSERYETEVQVRLVIAYLGVRAFKKQQG